MKKWIKTSLSQGISYQFIGLFDLLISLSLVVYFIFTYKMSLLSFAVTSFLSLMMVMRAKSQYQKYVKFNQALSLSMQLRLILTIVLSVLPWLILINLIIGA